MLLSPHVRSNLGFSRIVDLRTVELRTVENNRRRSLSAAEGYWLTSDRQDDAASAPLHIDSWRLVRLLLLTLVVPVAAALLFDWATGLWPFITIAAVLIFIPLAAIVVNRSALKELDRIVKIVAPELPPDEPGPETERTGEASVGTEPDAADETVVAEKVMDLDGRSSGLTP